MHGLKHLARVSLVLVWVAGCGARDELASDTSTPLDAGVDGGDGGGPATDGGLTCPHTAVSTPMHDKLEYCFCETKSTCAANERCCQPVHLTDDTWPTICASPDDPVCFIQH